MITCPHCDYPNPDDLVLCMQCSMPLRLEDLLASADPANGATGVLNAVTAGAGVPRWGTASLGVQRKLLLHVRGHDTPVVAVLGGELVLGRHDLETGASPEIDLDGYDAKALGVSRRHAVVFLEDEGLKIIDLGSANYTYINGQRLIPHQARIVRDGDELRLGRLILRVSFA